MFEHILETISHNLIISLNSFELILYNFWQLSILWESIPNILQTKFNIIINYLLNSWSVLSLILPLDLYKTFINLNINCLLDYNSLLMQLTHYYSNVNFNTMLLNYSNNFYTLLLTYNFTLLLTILNYTFTIYVLYYILVNNYFNSNIINTLQNSSLLKQLNIVDSEEELGSLDDSFTVIVLFMIVFGWFFFLSLSFSFFFKNQIVVFGVGTIMLIGFILLTPLSVLLDFGIAFASYIKGASAGSNLIIESIFDIISTLVVFTRFVVQNIRFVLIFFAYFELFEWTYANLFLENLKLFFSSNISLTTLFFFNNSTINFSFLSYYLVVLLSTLVGYAYYLVHLLILIFVQVTIYLLISFWLFFFFYTSNVSTKLENLFYNKKYNL